MADQGVVSLGNFAVNLLLARYFAQRDDLSSLGSFGVLMGLVLFFNGIQAALVIYPLTVRGTSVGREQIGRMAGISLVLTLLAWPLLGAGIIAAALLWRIDPVVGIWASAAMLLWQLQETLRRGLMAHLRFRAVLPGDAVSYLGQMSIVGYLAWRGTLTLSSTFIAMAVTSGLGALIQAVQIGVRGAAIGRVSGFARECWALGRWVMMGNLTTLFNVTLFEWNTGFWLGRATLGVYYAISTMVRLANPLSFAIASLILPNASRTWHEEGMWRAKRVMHRFGLLGTLLLAPYLALLILLPHLAITAFYGSNSPYHEYAMVLRIAAFASALAYSAIATGAFLNGVERTGYSFIGQFVSAASFALVAMPLTAIYGLIGAVSGWAISAGIQTLLYAYFIHRLPDERNRLEPEPVGDAPLGSPQLHC
jgi:O-antigen/teichoic acid export membrane protein